MKLKIFSGLFPLKFDFYVSNKCVEYFTCEKKT